MHVEVRYVLDSCTVQGPWMVINVRSRIQQWVVNGAEELKLDAPEGLHRISLNPGDWAGADQWGVREYANIAWTQEVIDAWTNRPQLGGRTQGE